MDKLKDVSEIKHTLIDWVKTESVKGLNSPEEVEIMGEVVDMIKDLAKAEKDCMEAWYYGEIAEAMEEGEEKMGYDRWRYASGRFAPKGRGTYGYMPPEPIDDPKHYTEAKHYAEPRMERMGYDKDTVEGVIDTMGEMWSKADNAMKRKMRAHVEDFMHQMSQEEL